MSRILIASVRRDIGKTSLIVGLGRALKGDFAYMKPFGDRLTYKGKQLWDHDSKLMSSIFDLKQEMGDINIGFEHSKLRYSYDKTRIIERLRAMAEKAEKLHPVVLIESGKDFSWGAGVHLDPITVAKALDATLLIVSGVNETTAYDDAHLIKYYVEFSKLKFAGVVFNKIPHVEDFRETGLQDYKELGVPVLGVIPYAPELTRFTVEDVMKHLAAKALSCEDRLDTVVKKVFIGAMSADTALRYPEFHDPEKLIITGGDRTDMMLVALETGASCVVITNDILPPPKIIAKFKDMNTPLLLVSRDTYSTAMIINGIMPLLTPEDTARIDLISRLTADHVDVKALFG